MTAGTVTLCLALALGLVACSDDEPDDAAPTSETTASSSTTTTAPERPASTTTTAFDPSSVAGEVEAAYLRSWDVYADAVYDLVLDEEALTAVYAKDGLSTLRAEIDRRISEDAASLVRVEHNYEIAMSSATGANVIDQLVNHQVLIDPVTKEPTEQDPNESQLLNFKMELIDGQWRVTLIQRVNS